MLMLMLMLLADIGGGGSPPMSVAPVAPVLAVYNTGGVPCLAAPLPRRSACPRVLSSHPHPTRRKCKN